MLYSFFLFFSTVLTAQSNGERKTEVQLAHDLKGQKAEFMPTKNGLFQVKLYTVKPAITHKTHHWFLQLLDKKDAFINISTLSLDAYHETNKDLKLNYMAPIFPLCNEGKYIIGFVNTTQSGKFILDLTIDYFGQKDTITLAMEVAASHNQLKDTMQLGYSGSIFN